MPATQSTTTHHRKQQLVCCIQISYHRQCLAISRSYPYCVSLYIQKRTLYLVAYYSHGNVIIVFLLSTSSPSSTPETPILLMTISLLLLLFFQHRLDLMITHPPTNANISSHSNQDPFWRLFAIPVYSPDNTKQVAAQKGGRNRECMRQHDGVA
jgi:hypothetical protein